MEGNNIAFLKKAYPNPFSALTVINYTVSGTQKIKINVLDAMGYEINQLVSGIHNAGEYEILWDGTDNRGVKVNLGIYFIKLESGSKINVLKIVMAP